MSTATGPGAAAATTSAPPPEAPAAEPRKPSLFRTEAKDIADFPPPKKIAPIRDGAVPPRDPATGKFMGTASSEGGDPNEGVIPELRDDASPQADGDGGEQEELQAQEPEVEAPLPDFVPVEIDGSRFETREALDNYLRRVKANASAEARRRAELEAQNAELMARLQPKADAETQVETETPTGPANPFSSSLIDDEELWTRAGADIENGKPLVAIARVTERFEKRIAELVDYINHVQGQEMTPMKTFLSAMHSINQTSDFMKQMSEAIDDSGALKYPNMRSRPAIVALTSILQKHNLPLTPSNFDLAYQIWAGPARSQGEKPPTRTSTPTNQSVASAAAVGGGRSRVPDPRAAPKKLSIVDEMNGIETHRGIFKTAP